ncbi:PREDICTED: uncharacterized protein LOC105367969 [Ceratosolen solmsi marchali]|uniref:Uncharacterized protein LOC105367969 n=1 Tax=Ceratosolen solmsi marchali TaxID=326594 RepID=A0AAJ6YVI4_9HYME|nr:PREDICTED: uncharacterized protein LOC105367969 [Ceratosolen solmsi marchali]
MRQTFVAQILLLQIGLFVGHVRTEISQRTNYQSIEQNTSGSSFASIENWKKDCSKVYSSTCLKLDVVSFVDRLSEQDDLGILPGVSVVKQNSSVTIPVSDVVANLARDFPNDVDKRMDAYLMHRIGTYLNSHAISIKLFDPRTFEATRTFNEAALEQLGLSEQHNNNAETARRKDKNGMGGLMAGLMMMKGTLGALGFGALAMLAGKALMTGLMALMLSAIVGLKSLTSGGEKKTTYEIVSKPVYTASHGHSSEEHHGAYGAGYGRSLDMAAETVHEALKKYGNVRGRRTIRAA